MLTTPGRKGPRGEVGGAPRSGVGESGPQGRGAQGRSTENSNLVGGDLVFERERLTSATVFGASNEDAG